MTSNIKACGGPFVRAMSLQLEQITWHPFRILSVDSKRRPLSFIINKIRLLSLPLPHADQPTPKLAQDITLKAASVSLA